MKRVSLKDIARLVGVSPSTVSFVLNGKAKQMRISDSLAEKITAVARQEGYHPNQVAVSLRTGKSHMLGMVVESMSGDFFASFARVIESRISEHGYKAVYCSTDNNPQKAQELIRMLSHQQVDGYIINPTPGMEDTIRQLVESNIPLVLVDSYFPGINAPHVLVDNANGIRQGMDHLFEKGYRNIGFVTVDLDAIQIQQRNKAFLESLAARNIPEKDARVLTLPYNQSKAKSLEDITRFIQDNPELQAVFFATNYLGLTGLESLLNLNKDLPGDLGMLCFDDHDVFRLYKPGISSIKQPVEDITEEAMRLLMKQLNGENTGENNWQVELSPRLVVRGST